MFKKKENNSSKVTNLDKLPITTVIAHGITIHGDIIGEGAIRIDGKIEGNVYLDKGVILGEKAEVTGTIKSNSVIIFGKLLGDLECKQLHLKSSGRIDGDMKVATLEVEMGGQYNGSLKMDTLALQAGEEQKLLSV
ncbi:polymer-forming cytoskeletal protein [Sphingobacterium sp. UT-1RO-CII-1]|uniref:bactofilin family protein n=1 Tax=Sphingobacterium sp. UT-1RO-CII-1 TaxID=2995225 RepID=UPI00227ACC16|nr:polymer-forming cytoskeletal protein [Sphingobacterium sp. UT-1RO-CII-1]MCY4778053.1 polymer-forming cytoskeletal protein [Sphingobacterium sp. UT-1RO-CII-1]